MRLVEEQFQLGVFTSDINGHKSSFRFTWEPIEADGYERDISRLFCDWSYSYQLERNYEVTQYLRYFFRYKKTANITLVIIAADTVKFSCENMKYSGGIIQIDGLLWSNQEYLS